MAKAVALCTCEKCGCQFKRVAYKQNRRDANDWEAWAVENITLCGDCWKAERDAEVEKKAADLNNGLESITIGTEKQIAWALKIRGSAVTKFAEMRKRIRSEYMDKFDLYVMNTLGVPYARYWIDHREDVERIGGYGYYWDEFKAFCSV